MLRIPVLPAALVLIGVIVAGANVPARAQSDALLALQADLIRQHKSGDLPAAVNTGEKLVSQAVAEHGADDLIVAQALNNLALVEELAGQPARAEQRYTRAIEIMKKQLGKRHPQVGLVLNNLAATAIAQCKLEAGRLLYLRAADILTAALGTHNSDAKMALGNYRRVSRALGWTEPGDDASKGHAVASNGAFALATPAGDAGSIAIPPKCVS